MGPDLSWSPGGTAHHTLTDGRGQREGGRLGPSRSLCMEVGWGEGGEIWVPLAQAHNGGPNTELRLRGEGGI